MSVYLPNVTRLELGLDSVADKSVVEAAAMAYVLRTGKAIYIPGLGQISPAPPVEGGTRTATRSTTKTKTKTQDACVCD